MHAKPFVIAEISGNHNGSLERAKLLVRAASASGASAVKFQTYTPETMTLDLEEFSVKTDHELWGGRRLFDLYREAHTPWAWHEELFSLARSLNIIPFSSPFDLTAVDLLESLNVSMYKIASLETGDLRLIKAVAATGKKVIVSTGATEWEEIAEVVDVFKSTGNKSLTLLLCTSSYPADPKESHLNRMTLLRKEFGCDVGLSDHTLGIGVSVAAVALGATVIEKHLTLRRADGGADSSFSMEPEEFGQLVTEANSAFDSLGTSEWKVLPSEQESRRLRRTLYVVTNVKAGEIVSHENVRAIRPGGGAHPRILDLVIGKKFKSDYALGTPMSTALVEP